MSESYQQPGQNASSGEWHHTDSSRPPMTCGRVSRYLKGEGRNALLGHIGTVIGANILYYLIVLVLNYLVETMVPYTMYGVVLSEVLNFILGILFGVLEYGLISIYMNLQYGQFTKFTDLFAGFRENSNKIIVIEAVLTLIQAACILPATIVGLFAADTPGLIIYIALTGAGMIVAFLFSVMFALSLYVLLDYPDMEWKGVLQRSRGLMKGHWKHYIYLELSFVPLYLLSVLSLGFAAIPVAAYEQSTLAAFYKGRMADKLM